MNTRIHEYTALPYRSTRTIHNDRSQSVCMHCTHSNTHSLDRESTNAVAQVSKCLGIHANPHTTDCESTNPRIHAPSSICIRWVSRTLQTTSIRCIAALDVSSCMTCLIYTNAVDSWIRGFICLQVGAHIMHLRFRCNFLHHQRLIVKSGYRVLKWPPTCNELWKDDSRW